MNSLRLVRISLLLLFMPLVGTAVAANDDGAPRPNVILCMADDQGWGDVAYNGHPVLKTPVLDEMAASGLRFDHFYAAAPVCSPTRGSVLTGRHPNRFGCFKWGHTLRPQEVTVAEALKKAGYATGHFGKWHLGSMQAASPVSPGQSGFDEWFSSPNFYENSPLFSHNGKVIETDGESSAVTVEAALGFIKQAVADEKPFLAVVWFGNPHTPHEALPELRKLYPDQPAKLQNYYGEITGIDRAMGMLRRKLREMSIAENTLVWYTSDNGARRPGSTGGLRGQKGSVWEGGLRVPGIIEWPARIPSPRSTDTPASTVDIYPTLLELASVEVPQQPPLDGVSLVPLIEGDIWRRDKPLTFWDYPARGRPMRSRQMLEDLRKQQAADGKIETGYESPFSPVESLSEDDRSGHAALRDGDYKLHRITRQSGKSRYLLYNLKDDPQETIDLLNEKPDRAERMKKQLEAWQRSVVHSSGGGDYVIEGIDRPPGF